MLVEIKLNDSEIYDIEQSTKNASTKIRNWYIYLEIGNS